jgi:hypothetical protein
MATTKLFKVAGFSTVNGETKLRFANDSLRVKVLAKHGHEDINLFEFEQAMTKLEAVKSLATIDGLDRADYQGLIQDYIQKHSTNAVEVVLVEEVAEA